MVDDLFVALGIDKTECLQEVEERDSSEASFMASVEECISERECKLYDEGCVKPSLYRLFSKEGVGDVGSRVSLGEGMKSWVSIEGGKGKWNVLCYGVECESAVHVL